MVAAKSMELAFIFVAGFLSANSGVDGSRSPCPSGAIVDLTEETLNILKANNKSGEVVRTKTWFENGKRFGCLCDFELCIPMCCPDRYASSLDSCVPEDSTFFITDLDHEEPIGAPHVFESDRCSSSSMDNWVLDHDFKLLPNGSIYLKDRSETIDVTGYCLLGKSNSQQYSVVIECPNSKWTNSKICFVAGTSVSMLFTLITYVVYAALPGLKNVQGWICRCFLASYVTCIFLVSTAVNVSLFPNLPLRVEVLHSLAAFGSVYFFTACFLWMNVMSIDTWRTLRQFRIRHEDNFQKCQEAKFVWYSIYVWGGSAAFMLLPLFYVLRDTSNPMSDVIWVALASVSLLSIVLCDICLYILTALLIQQRREETALMNMSINKRREENEQWFNLYVKLYRIMGGPLILYASALFLDNELYHVGLYILNGLQGISIFIIFVWKDDVKRSLRNQIHEIFRKLRSSLRRDTTFTISE